MSPKGCPNDAGYPTYIMQKNNVHAENNVHAAYPTYIIRAMHALTHKWQTSDQAFSNPVASK